MNDKAVSVACLNLHYFVYVSKAVLKQAETCRTSARNRLMSIAVMADNNIPEFTTTTRRTSVTRMVQRYKSATTRADNFSIDDIDNEQSFLSKYIDTASYMIDDFICTDASQIAVAIRDFNKRREKKRGMFSKLCGSSDDKKKQIINGISTFCNPGQLIAIMGPSGNYIVEL